MSELDTSRVRALTFDCYGTLVDWESGILDTLRRLISTRKPHMADADLLASFGETESSVQAGAYQPYREVLAEVSLRLMTRYGIEPSADETESLARGLPDWPVFPDTRAALGALTQQFRLAVVSNIDDDLFAGTCSRLGVDFDEVVTAEQVRSYKPRTAHFEAILQRLELPVSGVVHVAQSLYHDIAPANDLGITTIWVNRRAGLAGAGATPPTQARPDYTVSDLSSVVRLMRGEDVPSHA